VEEGRREASELRFSADARQYYIERMGNEAFDVLVIGGGITGVGIARDAALRGLKTALIEKDDFGAGTSSNSSKLVHGGFRYLKQGQFGLVREALVERKTLMDLAPHLVHPMTCILPVHRGSRADALLIPIGMWLYDTLAFGRKIGRHRMLSGEVFHKTEPGYRQEGVRKAVQYYDCWADDFRLVMATVQSAAQHGAVTANYVEAVDAIMENGRVAGVLARDCFSGKEIPIRSCVVVNATGPWSDSVRRSLVQQQDRRVRLTKGVHLIVAIQDLPLQNALMQFAVQDRRPIFAIPWENSVLLGTTDTDYEADLNQIPSDRDDVDYILESFNYYFPQARLTYDHVVSTFAGLRPLIFEEGKPVSKISREYQIFEGPDSFFSIIGGKLTTYRTMAKRMVDRLVERLTVSHGVTLVKSRCVTDRVPLFGGEMEGYEQFRKKWVSRLIDEFHLDRQIALHLIETYGTCIRTVLGAIEETSGGTERILPDLPYLWGELPYVMDHEMAQTLDDFLMRRTHIHLFDRRHGMDVYQEVADRMQKHLGWSDRGEDAQINRYKLGVRLAQRFREESPT